MKSTLITGTIVLAGIGGVTADQVINPYMDRGQVYELDIKHDIEQGERVEISKDEPKMTLKGWNDEYAISIKPNLPTNPQGRRPLLTDRVEYKSGEITAFIEPLSDTEFDIDFTLDSKPDTNVFTYSITGAEEFDFFYQPALTQQEIDEGASRPDNVVGSYAVYHKTKANHRVGSTNYATGKVMHIYRPKAIDADGVEEWAELNYGNGLLSVTVPQKFLDDAVYPVVVDPTFGYTSLGAVTNATAICAQSSDQSVMSGVAFNLPEDGTVTAIDAGLDSSSGTETADTITYIYLENGGGSGIHTNIATSTERANLSISTTEAFYTFSISAVLTADDYILAALCDGVDVAGLGVFLNIASDDTNDVNYYTETTTGSSSYATRKNEQPWTETAATSNDKRSIYATYTASAAPTSPASGVIEVGSGTLEVGSGVLEITN